MAKGGAKRGLGLLAAALAFVLLVIAGIVPNPFPGIWEWIGQDRPLAPDLAWQERLGARPAAAAPAGDLIAVDASSSTQVRDRGTGNLVSPRNESEAWNTDWVVVAGSGDDAVVIMSRDGRDGYEVRDPTTGRRLHRDEDAVAAWGFREGWLDLRCAGERACQLRSYRPSSPDDPVWATDLPGERSGMLGGNPDLAGPRISDASRIHSQVSGPEPTPPLLGFTVTRGGSDVVVVVNTDTGEVLQQLEPERGERVIVVAGRVIRSKMERLNDVCVSTVTAHDPATGTRVWGPEDFHMWGTGDVGCEQRVPPLSRGAAMTGVSLDGRPLVIDAYDGRLLWSGKPGQTVEGLTPEHAVVRGKNGVTRFGVRLGTDGDRLWERDADDDAGVTLARCGVVVSDRSPNRVYVWDPDTGEVLLSTPTSARVLACMPDGVLLADGRSIGFAPFEGAAPPADPGEDDPDEPLDQK